MIINFENCNVTIGGSGIFCDSASISTSNSVQPNYQIGINSPISYSPNGPLQSNIQLSYILKNYDENYYIIKEIKEYTGILTKSPTIIDVGGITGIGYITNYSFQISSNEPVKASVSYTLFTGLAGTLTNKIKEVNNTGDWSGIMHGLTSRIIYGTTNSFPIFDMGYSFNTNWNPIYVINNQYPQQIDYINSEEEFSFTRENFYNINFTGEDVFDSFFNTATNGTIELNNLSYLDNKPKTSFVFNITGGKVIESRIEAKTDDFVKTSTIIRKAY